MSIDDKVYELMLEFFKTKNLDIDRKNLKPDAKFTDDLGLSSIHLWELVLIMEDEFELEVPDEDLEKLVTVQDAIDFINSHVEKE